MTKKFFTNATPKAAKGILKVYQSAGYEVRAKIGGNGLVTVVAMKDEDEKRKSLPRLTKSFSCRAA